MKRVLICLFLILTDFINAQDCIKFEPLKETNKFILVVDRSGSMSGNAISQAKLALNIFVSDMHQVDEAAIIAFDDQIEVLHSGTSDKNILLQSINRISASGGTHLYDALGKASILVHQTQSQKIIIFLTDGHDGGSQLRVDDLNNINLSGGIYVYSIGLGDVNKEALKKIAEKTGGDFTYTPDSYKLSNIYSTALANYYHNFENRFSSTSKLVICSIPSNQQVILNNMILSNRTPVVADCLSPGNYEVKVRFSQGDWKCHFEVEKGQKGIINARESDLGKDIVITSDIKSALVFLDGTFIGYTSMYPIVEKSEKKRVLRQETITDYSRQLIVRNIPKGNHSIRVIGLPDTEGFFQPVEDAFRIGNKNFVIKVSVTKATVFCEETDQQFIQKKSDSPFIMEDPFKDLE